MLSLSRGSLTLKNIYSRYSLTVPQLRLHLFCKCESELQDNLSIFIPFLCGLQTCEGPLMEIWGQLKPRGCTEEMGEIKTFRLYPPFTSLTCNVEKQAAARLYFLIHCLITKECKRLPMLFSSSLWGHSLWFKGYVSQSFVTCPFNCLSFLLIREKLYDHMVCSSAYFKRRCAGSIVTRSVTVASPQQ